ncbi:conserved hypothetical protein [Histoplasma capsulatum H143]|uniref:Ankyrin 2,3/unc44 n=1 Tax=Ajellomyces capsulatus (strain H143) TaxID=544712 RepID=C6HBP4_AJECH|nr:conserved hypothetical protein [Histoplasma capsulatum H143]
MPSLGPESPKPRTCDVAQPSSRYVSPPRRTVLDFDDAELDEYLQNRRSISVDEFENVPESFIQRLRERAHSEHGAVKSHPVDLDQVSARLLHVATDKEQQDQQLVPQKRLVKYEDSFDGFEWPNESVCGTTPSPDPEAERREALQREADAYQALVQAGGRPSHSFHGTPSEIYKNPGEYRELLSFWVPESSQQEEYLFSNQWSRWRTFRKFQRFMRERNTEDERVISIYSGHDYTELMRWFAFIDHQQQVVGEEGRFPIYARAVKDRLVRHGFTRTFQLDEDPTRQDNLTTWIEYLGYEYWWFDRYALSSRQQEWLDSKWKEVVDSNVLTHFETQESVYEYEHLLQRVNELELSQRAVETAKSSVLAQKAVFDSENPSHSIKENDRRLQEAQSKLDVAEKDHDSMKRRYKLISDFVRDTVKTRRSKKNSQRHAILLRWILDQLLIIEHEMEQVETRTNALNEESINGKPKPNQTDYLNAGKGHGGQKDKHTENHTALNRQAPVATTSQGRKGRKRSHDITNEAQQSKRPRGNGRQGTLSRSKISESVAAAAATEAAAKMSRNPNPPTSRMTRQQRIATTVAAEGRRDVKDIDEVSRQVTSHGKRLSKQQRNGNQTRNTSAYAAHAVTSKAATEQLQIPEAAASKVARPKSKAATVGANKDGDAETDKLPIQRGVSLRNRRKKNLSSNPQLPLATGNSLRRSRRLAEKRGKQLMLLATRSSPNTKVSPGFHRR